MAPLPSSTKNDNDYTDDAEMTDDNAVLTNWQQLTQQIATFLDPKSRTEWFWRDDFDGNGGPRVVGLRREDDRVWSQCRVTTVQRGPLGNNSSSNNETSNNNNNYANAARNNSVVGSASVTLGSTRVIAAVSVQIGTCTTAAASSSGAALSSSTSASVAAASKNSWTVEGDIQVIISPAEGGGPLVALQSWLERILLTTVPLDQLAISPMTATEATEKRNDGSATKTTTSNQAFRLVLSLLIVEHAGNLRDAALLAAVAALRDTILPAVAARRSDNLLYLVPTNSPGGGQGRRLQLPLLPVPLTMGVWRKPPADQQQQQGRKTGKSKYQLFLDPTQDEEMASHNIVTVVINANAISSDTTTTTADKDARSILSLECAGVVHSCGGGSGESSSTRSHFSSTTTSVGAVDPATLVLAVKLAQARAEEMKPLLL